MWIAFKFVSLSYDKQLLLLSVLSRPSCELLSNLYLCPMTNNSFSLHLKINCVVNCFQICIFVLWQTTEVLIYTNGSLLWIAFKFVSLSYDKQRSLRRLRLLYSCELLSNLYLCPMTNNLHKMFLMLKLVVNCFQICIFVLWQTTRIFYKQQIILLWIAFKFVSLSYDKQHRGALMKKQSVVNCFQICIFVLWQTTL